MGILSYAKTLWQDRAVATPNDYTASGAVTGTVTLVPKTGTVTQAGTPINASNLNKLEAGVEASYAKGTNNADQVLLYSMGIEIDTRSVVITRSGGVVTMIEEKDGSTVMRTTNLYRTDSLLTSVDQVGGGKTVTYTINRDTSYNVTSVTKTVV